LQRQTFDEDDGAQGCQRPSNGASRIISGISVESIIAMPTRETSKP
jgi:hypothetical protein